MRDDRRYDTLGRIRRDRAPSEVGKITHLDAVHVRKVRIPNSILGRTIAVDARGDITNGKFYIYKLSNGKYVPAP